MVFADSVNVAKRLSVRAENDLLQENYMEDEKYSEGYCQSLAFKLSSLQDLPRPCQKFEDVVKTLERRTTGTAHDAAIAFQGMRAGSAAAARANRAKGKEHYAQVQRRYTGGKRFNSQRSSTTAA